MEGLSWKSEKGDRSWGKVLKNKGQLIPQLGRKELKENEGLNTSCIMFLENDQSYQ